MAATIASAAMIVPCIMTILIICSQQASCSSLDLLSLVTAHRQHHKHHHGFVHHSSSTTMISSCFDPLNFKVHFHNQTLDHFNYLPQSGTTFPQKYVVAKKYWGGPNTSAPLLVYLSGETAMTEQDYHGFWTERAHELKALLVFIEHRFYGESIPFGSKVEAYKNSSTLGHLNSAQALADYAEIITSIKKSLGAEHSPVIVYGGFYGGTLAAWFRLKYPHIAMAALASSAPMHYLDGTTPPDAYYKVVTKDYMEISKTCTDTVKKSWNLIDRLATLPDGLIIMSKNFRTCSPIKDVFMLKLFLQSGYAHAARYASPSMSEIRDFCKKVDADSQDKDILKRVGAGFTQFHQFFSTRPCLEIGSDPPRNESMSRETPWPWQLCSELIIPLGFGNDTMFYHWPYNKTKFEEFCKTVYGIQPNYQSVNTNYGGKDMELTLRKFSSNIIFSNGLKDPYSSAGVRDDISDTNVAIKTKEGSHCNDLRSSYPNDPKWLQNQRRKELHLIKKWLKEYYKDLKEFY